MCAGLKVALRERQVSRRKINTQNHEGTGTDPYPDRSVTTGSGLASGLPVVPSRAAAAAAHRLGLQLYGSQDVQMPGGTGAGEIDGKVWST